VARIDWVKQRLDNWALWHDRMSSGGLGYCSSSVLLSIPSGGTREAVMPVLELEAELTHQAVESLKLGKGHLYETLRLVYLKNTPISDVARQMRRAVSTIHDQLGQADAALARWFHEHQEAKRRARVQTPALDRKGGFTP